MMTEMESLQNRLAYYQYHLKWLKAWSTELALSNVRDYGSCEKAIKRTEVIIFELEQAIAIESIVQLCLTGR